MQKALRQESERLARAWMQHEAAHLRRYLVTGVEDPRINLQSVLSRHFLVRAITGGRFDALTEQEGRFSAVMNWLIRLAGRGGVAEELDAVLYALRQRADNAEGVEIPRFVGQTFSALPAAAGDLMVPNYVESFLTGTRFMDRTLEFHAASLETFCTLWGGALAEESPATASLCPSSPSSQPSTLNPQPLSVLEPACGSANDFRFLHAYGIARRVDYTGFDLCSKNIVNARALFPGVRFELGNAFEIARPDNAFDLCFVHDLFEHLSPEGLHAAGQEVCRVTRQGLCVGFFNMDEIPEHVVNPVDEYHWNTLSMGRMRELFASHGFAGQVIHIGTFLREQIGCEQTHNPNAYTFVLHRHS